MTGLEMHEMMSIVIALAAEREEGKLRVSLAEIERVRARFAAGEMVFMAVVDAHGESILHPSETAELICEILPTDEALAKWKATHERLQKHRQDVENELARRRRAAELS